MADRNLEAGFFLQKCQECDFPDYDHSQSLYLALERQNHFVYGQVSDIIPRVHDTEWTVTIVFIYCLRIFPSILLEVRLVNYLTEKGLTLHCG